ncbi:hypothetical protein CRG98_029542 [Punica granatum]|uniref:Retrotransposon gag domain-containing protein n=1 Tax=Punica granatum TaxID=22663 RepID=A0A2I0J2Y8_PUNGR|nr:hypothetical protein CRG98_029542 [Punica granatum]
MRGSPHLLQIWLLAHIRPFCSSHPFSYIADERSLIERLVPIIPPPEHSFSEWRRFWRELTLARFLWVARWNPGGPMVTGCPGIVGVPLLSHLGSTLIFPGRVIRQLGGLQDVPAEADRLPFRIQWADSTSIAPARFLQIREIRRQRDASIIQRLYFPEHPTDDERVFAATSAYVAQFYARGLASPRPSHAAPTPRAAMAEGDHVDISEEVNPSVPTLSQPPPTHAPLPLTPAGTLPAYSGALPTHLPPPASSGAPLPPASLTSAVTDDQARITALEGTGRTVPPRAPRLHRDKGRRLSRLPGFRQLRPRKTRKHPRRQLCTRPWLILSPARIRHHRPPRPSLFHRQPSYPRNTFYPRLRLAQCTCPDSSSSRGAPFLSVSTSSHTTFHESGTPTHEAQFASPTHFFPEADTEQERRLKRMEETIRALQAGDARPDVRYSDCSLFPAMRLPPKFKIPEFKTYEGTTDPRHHLRHYRGKMLQYWEYEEFVIHSFQDSLSGSALNWFMSLKADDIPTWEDLSRKFTDQYRYCTEAPPTLLELSTKEMARGQKFEEYAAKWRAQAAKHIPPISEAQQIQLFHFTLRGVKGEESSKKVPVTSSSSSGRRGKEVTVNTVNTAQQLPQQYSMNYTAAPPTAPSYAPQAPQYRPQASTQPIYYSTLPPPPPSTVPSPVVHHYAPTLSQAPQYQPPVPRTSQPTQRVPPPQSQQGGTAQPQPRRQYPALPVPLSHIYRQIRDKIGTIALGPSFDPTIQDQSKQCEYHRGKGEGEQGCPSPFMIEYVPAEVAVGFTGTGAPPAPFVIDIPAQEPYSDDKVPRTYEGGVGNLEQQFGVMGITRSGRLYENPAVADKGKAPAMGIKAAPEASPTPPKEVTEEEAEAFIKVIKASDYKVVEQMAKSPAHISLLALLLNSGPHREALVRVLTAAQVPKGTPRTG